jgi:biopolymer transport protein TolQ
MDAFAQVASTPLAGTAPPIDMSVYGLFMQADWVVKAVMIALLLASFWSWAIIFEKIMRLRALKKSAQTFEDTFWSGVSLEDLYDRVGAKPDDPMSSIFSAAMREWRRSVSKGLAASATARGALRQRIEQVMSVTIQREMEAIEKRLGFLATVGANATFVGLFGTLWGIMNAFGHIAVSKNTSLAVVAPGIAEALFATAIGLFAAIPALIAYNKFQGDVARGQARMESFADEFSSILSRQIDTHLSGDRAA